jgi:hypothetical protein
VAEVRAEADRASEYYSEREGIPNPIDSAKLRVVRVGLPRRETFRAIGMVPWGNTILLDHSVPLDAAEWSAWTRELIAHETWHLWQINLHGKGPIGWGLHYIKHRKDAEAQAYHMARCYRAARLEKTQ